MIINIIKKYKLINKDILIITDNIIIKKLSYNINIYQNIILDNPIASYDLAANLSVRIKNSYPHIKYIITIGSGSLNDISKLIAYKLKINYIIIASALSMNGYISKNSSLFTNHNGLLFKKSLLAQKPLEIYFDNNLIKYAPKYLLKAGIADILSFATSHFDWKLSHLIFDVNYDAKIIKMIENEYDYFIQLLTKYDIIDHHLILSQLQKIIIISGEMMNEYNSSIPVSGGEHLIAHLIEMKYKDYLLSNNINHGLLISITMSYMIKAQQKLAKDMIKDKFTLKYKSIDKLYLDKLFNKEILNNIKSEINNKIFSKNKFNIIIDNFNNNKSYIINDLNKLLKYHNKILSIIDKFNIINKSLDIKIDENEFCNIVKKSHLIRNRFTSLDLINFSLINEN